MKGFAKLLALSQEMPWFKETVLNSYSLIDQLGLNEKMTEDKIRLSTIIQENGWATLA